MTLLLALLLQIPWPGPGRASATPALAPKAVVNTARGTDLSGSSYSSISTGSISHTSGNLIVVACRSYGVATTTVTDVAGNTYTALTRREDGSEAFQWFYAKNITGSASNVVSCNFSTASSYVAVIAFQVSGASTTSPLQSETGALHSASTTWTSPTFSTTGAYSIVFFGASIYNVGVTWTAGLIGGTTADGISGSEPSNVGIAVGEYRSITGAASSITAAMTSTSSTAGIMAVAVFQ